MKMRSFFIPLATLVFSCSIISEDALDYIPSAARPKVITVTGDGISLTGIITYEGSFKSPSKITITWQGDTFLNRVPVANTLALNSSTVYELTGGRVTKITNINTRNVASRTETIAYNPQGLITKNVQTNKSSVGDAAYEIVNDFFYKDSVLDSVAQVVKWWDGVVWPGFMVRLTGIDHRPATQALYDKCTAGTYLQKSANFVGIMPYDPTQKYTLDNGFIEYYNETTKEYELSSNDFTKSFFVMDDTDDEYKPTSGRSYSQIQQYGELIADCTTLNTEMYWDLYYSYNDVQLLDNYGEVVFEFAGKDSQTMNPIYYHVLLAPSTQDHPLMITQADVLAVLNKKTESLYFNDYRQNLPASSATLIGVTRKTTEFDLSK